MQQGLPTRTATSDANEGIIDPPVQQTATRQISTQGGATDNPTGVALQGVARTLGDALTKYREQNATEINELRTMRAAAEQGTEIGLSEDTKAKRRTGWQRMVYGENPEYRGAQQRAVSNAVNQYAATALSEIDTFAGEEPEAYQERITQLGSEMVERYSDPETRTLVANVWAERSVQLAAEHAKARSAWTQMESRRVAAEEMQTNLDLAIIQRTNATTPEEEVAALESARTALNTCPIDMHPVACREMKMETVLSAVADGNSGVFNLAQDIGLFENMTAAEADRLRTATRQHAAEVAKDATKLEADADLSIAQARSVEEVDSIINDAVANLEQFREISTVEQDSPAYKAVTDAMTRLLSKRATYHQQARDAAQDDANLEADMEAYRTGTAWRTGVTGPEQKRAADAVILEELQDYSEDPTQPLTVQEATRLIATRPDALNTVLRLVDKNDSIDSSIIGETIRQSDMIIQENLEEDGTLAPERGSVILQNLETILNNRSAATSLGAAQVQQRRWQYDQLDRGYTWDKAQEYATVLERAKENSDVRNNIGYAQRMIMAEQGVENTSQIRQTAEVSRAYQDYATGIVLYEGDSEKAWEHAMDRRSEGVAQYNGHLIEGGRDLDQVFEVEAGGEFMSAQEAIDYWIQAEQATQGSGIRPDTDTSRFRARRYGDRIFLESGTNLGAQKSIPISALVDLAQKGRANDMRIAEAAAREQRIIEETVLTAHDRRLGSM